MNIFDSMLMNRLNSGALSRRQVCILRRSMREFAKAHRDNTAPPVLPKTISRKFQSAFIWALYRLSVEQPGYFALGLLCAIPSMVLIAYFLVLKAVAFLETF